MSGDLVTAHFFISEIEFKPHQYSQRILMGFCVWIFINDSWL